MPSRLSDASKRIPGGADFVESRVVASIRQGDVAEGRYSLT